MTTLGHPTSGNLIVGAVKNSHLVRSDDATKFGDIANVKIGDIAPQTDDAVLDDVSCTETSAVYTKWRR